MCPSRVSVIILTRLSSVYKKKSGYCDTIGVRDGPSALVSCKNFNLGPDQNIRMKLGTHSAKDKTHMCTKGTKECSLLS